MDVNNGLTNDQMKSYWSNEVAKLLDISTSTLRKWSIALETEGYPFIRDENDRRAYLERDLMPLQKMKELLKEGMGMDNAAKAVVLRFSESMSHSVTIPVPHDNERSEERYLEIVGHVHDIRQENVQLKEHLGRIEQRMDTQNENLTQLLREVLETRRMIAATQERSIWRKIQFWRKH